MPALTVIDGSGFIYRAFHALPPLTTPDGLAVGAVVGFANMILRWQEIHQPENGVIVFDHGRSEWRNHIFPQYKAHRPETPPELTQQFPLIKEFCRAMNIPMVEKRGVEADDLIASIAQHAVSQGWSVDVVTSDKDLFQISAPSITMHDPIKNRSLDVSGVQEMWGVRPDQIPHVQALAGDTADGIPGIPGIGIKTATAWIADFGSLSSLIDRVGELKTAKKRELVQHYADQARLSYQLALLHTHYWDESWDLRQWVWSPHVDQAGLRALVSKLQLKALTDRLTRRGVLDPMDAPPQMTVESANAVLHSVPSPHTPPFSHESLPDIVDRPCVEMSQDRLIQSIQESGTVVVLPDSEESLGQEKAGQFMVCWGGDQYTWTHWDTLAVIWQDSSCLKIVHHLKDWVHQGFVHFPRISMVKIVGNMQPADDLMILSYVIHGTGIQHDLESIFHHAGWGPEISRSWNSGQKMLAMRCIWEKNMLDLREKRLMRVYYDLDRPLVGVLAKMERLGIPIDRQGLENLEKIWGDEIQRLEQRIMDVSGQRFNPASPKQLGKVLFEDLGWPNGKKGKSGAYQTGGDVLARFAARGYPLAEMLLDWRQLNKLIHTYARGLVDHINPQSQRVHTTYSMVTTSTGRLSSLEPNLQNIPIRTERGRLLRGQFRAPQGYAFLSLDYAQIELRLLAAMGPVLSLQQAFESCQDIHTATAAQLFHVNPVDVIPDQRRTAKGINFGILYGISAFGLAEHLRIDRGQAKTMIAQYFTTYPEIQDYLERTRQQARDLGYVETLWGRRCMIPGARNAHAAVRASAERQAINAPLQGTSADIIKRAMIQMDAWMESSPYDVTMILQIHDELVFLVRSDQAIEVRDRLVPIMENVVHLSVPLVVSASISPTLE